MAKPKTLSCMFPSISKEEMKESVKCDFVALKTKMELEKAMKVDVVKRSIEKPRKTIREVVLLPPISQLSPSAPL